MTDAPPPPRDFHLRIDLRDILGVAGALLALVGAAAIHWGLAAAVAGAGLFAVAYRLSR
jgi:hypothetical protein